MPPAAGSPARPSRPKRESLTITRSVGKALADVMNKDKESTTIASASSSTESEDPRNTSTPTRTRTIGGPKPFAATTREGHRAGRPSLDVARGGIGSDKSTPKLVKRPPPSSTSKASLRTDKSSAPPSSSAAESSPSKPASKPRASLTLRGLSAALQPKPALPQSALPKYKPKTVPDAKPPIPRSGARKRLSDWDGDKHKGDDKVEDKPKEEVKSSDDDGDDGFVNVERPISPLPRRAARKTILPVSLSLTPSTPPKRNVLHKASSSISSTPPRPPKAAKTSTGTTPLARVQQSKSSVPRPASSASAHSQRATPTQSSRKPASASRARTISSVRSPARRRPTVADSPLSTSSKLTSSPGNPFQLPETSGSSLLSPPLSPFLEGVSLDSIDAGDVSALLDTVTSPTKPASTPSRANREVPPETPSRNLRIFPNDPNSPPPQTPVSQSSLRPISALTTDHRQSVLSLRQFLENSGDLEHLLSQPLPSIFTPDARERLLSFGFSPGFDPPPFPSVTLRPEPQTPCPVPDESTFTSISQVLFPSVPSQTPSEEQAPASFAHEHGMDPLAGSQASAAVQVLRMQLASAESQRQERDAKIESLERQLVSSRDAREQEAAELSTQVSDLEEQLKELLGDRERETGKRVEELEERLRDKDAELERQVAAAVSEVQERSVADQERLLSMERRKWCIRSTASAWECAKEVAYGLDASMQQLRQSLMC